MLPPTPLDHGEQRTYLLITSDLNKFDRLPNFSLNVYWGIGNNSNVGLGYGLPLGISHITAAKYFDVNHSYPKYTYASFNNLFGTFHINPRVEFGAGVSKKDDNKYHDLSIGYWFLINTEFPILLSSFSDGKSEKGEFKIHSGPSIKYKYINKDYTLSIQNHIGFLSNYFSTIYKDRLKRYDKIKIPNAEIDSLNSVNLSGKMTLLIFMKDKEIYDISKYEIYISDRIYGLLENGICEYIPIIKVRRFGVNERHSEYLGIYHMDFNQLINDINNGKDIEFKFDSEYTLQAVKYLKWYILDWSIGLGKLNHTGYLAGDPIEP